MDPALARKRVPEAGPSNSSPKRPRLTPEPPQHIPDAALLYHTATSAHAASTRHLQQAFLPEWVQTRSSSAFDPIPLYPSQKLITPDRDAARKALSLQILALDLLGVGLKRPDLSDGERAAFSIEFVEVGIKVMEVERYDRKGKAKAVGTRLAEDIQEALASGIAACERSSQLVRARSQLEWLTIKLSILENRIHAAKRIARQYLRSDHCHSYSLYFLLLDKAATTDCGEAMTLIDEIKAKATAHGHRQVLQILEVVRCRLEFAYRRWDAIPASLDEIANLFSWSEESFTSTRLSTESVIWHTTLMAHYLALRSLYEGRIGHDTKARGLLKRLYLMLDEAAESGVMDQLRASGGLVEVRIDADIFYVQSTPPNVLYILTFLATVTTRRDFMGPIATCKTLAHIKAMRGFETIARKDDMWDTGFASQHGLADVWNVREGILKRMAEVMLEEATAMVIRSDFTAADKLLADFAQSAEDMADLYPHLCLVHAMMAQLLGRDAVAVRHYQAALALLTAESELALQIEASLLGVKGLLQGVKDDHKLQMQIKDLAAKCKRTSSMGMNAIGQLLSALSDDNLMSAKKKIGSAYELCQQSNNNLLRALVFAFTSTTHLTGNEKRVQKQLETGLDIATLLGGKDRADQVGQPVLGLWFSVRLKKLHHRNQDHLAFNIAKSRVQRYSLRLNEIMEYGNRKYLVKDA